MPWSNQTGGGGSGGNGGGPWGQRGSGGGGGGGGPWGSGPSGGGNKPPDLEDIIRRGQDRLRGMFPGGPGTGGGQIGGRGMGLIAVAALAVWLATGFYTVRPNEIGLNMIFGRYVSSSANGLRYNFPFPIGSVEKPLVTQNRTIEIGVRAVETGRRPQRPTDSESLMLTGDENIVDIDFTLQWQVDPNKVTDFVFNLQNPEGTVRVVAESAMREVIGRRNIQSILTTDRAAIEAEVQQLTQETLNGYGAGIEILRVNLQRVDPPQQVIDAFRDVQAARQDQDRVRNEAETYSSRVLPEARGEATRIVQGAEAYRERSIAEARGAASRFTQVYEEYRKAPEVTRERMFLETMERVLGGADKLILDQPAGAGGVVPYLPLGELGRRPTPPAATGAAR
ncbi:FtsH protease activity modulator HflK [Enterovirga sp.]|jgi:membrane protease subunit HflK|uniref:FtsH protease activity modulator HflK n=1 Tax=Enterovirga sp. TaxID=2026350 RepID=UPI002615C66F|nr:FtsH protease activity modulator HflK [Enterovirga sp.]MDB5590663.1 HflK protein [Enterovirga sp.]